MAIDGRRFGERAAFLVCWLGWTHGWEPVPGLLDIGIVLALAWLFAV